MNNKNKVDKYYTKYQEAAQAVEDYLEEVGEALVECEYVLDSSEFRDKLDQILDARETARISLERVVREERTGVGPITVSNRMQTKYDGEYLFGVLPEAERDEVVQIVYKVDNAAFRRMLAKGVISQDTVEKAVVSQTESISLRGVPKKIGLS